MSSHTVLIFFDINRARLGGSPSHTVLIFFNYSLGGLGGVPPQLFQ